MSLRTRIIAVAVAVLWLGWFVLGSFFSDAERKAAWWLPDVPAGAQRVCSNDVYVDHRGLIYLIDRNRGLSILERV